MRFEEVLELNINFFIHRKHLSTFLTNKIKFCNIWINLNNIVQVWVAVFSEVGIMFVGN
jgi:hypothetical protein